MDGAVRLEMAARALAGMAQGTLDVHVLAGMNRGMAFARGLAMRDAQGRGNGVDELGRPRRKPGAPRLWQTIQTIPARRIGADTYTAGLKAGSPQVLWARIQELGGQTRPHIIVPKRFTINMGAFSLSHGGGRLVFFWKRAGGVVAFAKVRHPGSKIPARPYLRPAIDRAKAVVQQEVGRDVRVAIERALAGA